MILVPTELVPFLPSSLTTNLLTYSYSYLPLDGFPAAGALGLFPFYYNRGSAQRTVLSDPARHTTSNPGLLPTLLRGILFLTTILRTVSLFLFNSLPISLSILPSFITLLSSSIHSLESPIASACSEYFLRAYLDSLSQSFGDQESPQNAFAINKSPISKS